MGQASSTSPAPIPASKSGGYLRADHTYGDGGNQSAYYLSNANARHDRFDTDAYGFRARINLTVDFRTQSDYGTIRAYAAIIGQQSQGDASGNGSAGILRAFIQFAGFTVGHAESMFEFFQPGNYTYRPPSVYSGWTGDNGIDLIAYTWQIGNGFSASVDIEDGGNANAEHVRHRPRQVGTERVQRCAARIGWRWSGGLCGCQ